MAAELLLSLAPDIDGFALVSLPDGLALSVSRGDETTTLTIALSREERRELGTGLLAESGDGFKRTFSAERLAMPPHPGRHELPTESDPAPAPPRDPGPRRQAGAADTARMQGFSGDACDRCGGTRMLRSGTCLTCQDCGATTGCS